MTTANQIADYILFNCQAKKKSISNLELQKMVYYCQAWHLACYDRPLFSEEIEAWVHGPVQRGLYRRFKRFGWTVIEDIPSSLPSLPSNETSLVDEVLRVYCKFTPWQLEKLSHDETPWKHARRGLPPEKESTNVISHASMRNYYKGLMKSASKG